MSITTPHRPRLPHGDVSTGDKLPELAVEVIGKPIPNTALLAAFLALTEHVPQKALAAALKGRFHGPVLDKNLELIAKAAGAVEQGEWKEKADA